MPTAHSSVVILRHLLGLIGGGAVLLACSSGPAVGARGAGASLQPAAVDVPRLQLAASVCDNPLSAAGRRYCIVGDALSWKEAAANCQSLGGHLANLESDTHHDALLAVAGGPLSLPQFGATNVWLDLRRTWTGFRWGHSSTPVQGWNEGEPNNSGGQEDCGEWLPANGRLNDIPCDAERIVLCEYKGESSRGCTGRLLGTAEGSYCLHADKRVPRSQADAVCASEDARLVALESPAEAAELYALLGMNVPHTNLWIGMSDSAREGDWRWQSGLAVTTAHWGDGEPNNLGGEHCGEWRMHGDGYNDIPCHHRLASLCEL